VLHVALRAPRDAVINSDGVNVVPEVWSVKDKIKQFSETFRSGSWVSFQTILFNSLNIAETSRYKITNWNCFHIRLEQLEKH
jgi:glucose-6-phosphate isomerase